MMPAEYDSKNSPEMGKTPHLRGYIHSCNMVVSIVDPEN
jgi:hypothetical protein